MMTADGTIGFDVTSGEAKALEQARRPRAARGAPRSRGRRRFAKRRAPIPMRDWKAVVGPRHRRPRAPGADDRGVLLVKAATSVWANELSMLAPEIVVRLCGAGYAVESLRFRVGALDTPERPPERRVYRKVPLPKAARAGAASEHRRRGGRRAPRCDLEGRQREPRVAGVRHRSAARRSRPSSRWKRKLPAGPYSEDSPAASRRNPGGDSGRRR